MKKPHSPQGVGIRRNCGADTTHRVFGAFLPHFAGVKAGGVRGTKNGAGKPCPATGHTGAGPDHCGRATRLSRAALPPMPDQVLIWW